MSPPAPQSRINVVAVWNEMTPYRLHFLKRMLDECHGVNMVNVFTHSVTENSMPWQISLPTGLDVRFNEPCRIVGENTYFHRKCFGLSKWVLSIVDAESPTFVLMAGHSDFTRLLIARGLRRMRVPVIHMSDANVFGLGRGGRLKGALRCAYHSLALRCFDGYMTMGTCGRAYYGLLGGRARPVFLSPYEPDYSLIESCDEMAVRSLAARLRLDPGRRRFLYSGRLVGWKRVDLLIKAFVKAADLLPRWDLLVVGGGPDLDSLKAAVPDRLRSRVMFTGFLQMDDVRACYKACHVLVHPSNWEPWALVINEAVAAGMAVIATDVTGAAVELVRHRINGYLVRPDSEEELLRAIVAAADEETMQGMRTASRSVLADWRRTADPLRGVVDAAAHFGRERAKAGTGQDPDPSVRD
jgi:glycosyltransferase involved in cell wall biosynthesis